MDRYGPEKLLQAYRPSTGSLGLLVIDNTVLGPGLGALYPLRRISIELASELARFHTLMNSLFEIPFGGACACVMKGENWKQDLDEFGVAVAPFANSSYVACPSEWVSQEEMEFYAFASGDVRGSTGKPASLKGIPFEAGAVGLGIAHCALQAARSLNIAEPKIAIHGLGRDGLFAARVLEKNGAKVVVASDSDSGTSNPEGLDVESLSNMVKEGGRLDAFPRGKGMSREGALLGAADIVVIAGGGLFSQLNANDASPKVLIEASPGAVGRDAGSVLEAKGTLVVPDLLACGGSCLCAHVEHMGGNVVDMDEIVVNSMKRLTARALEESGKSLREWAERMAFARIDEAIEKRSRT